MEAIDQNGHADLAKICGERWDLIDAVRESVDLARGLSAISNDGADRAGDAPASLDRTVGNRYRLEQGIGAGAMGVVYRAFDLELNRSVAVKILRAAILGPKEAQARFIREGEAMAAIHHAAVATVFDRGETDDGDTFIVMELLDGVSLSAICEVAESRLGNAADDASWIATALQCDAMPEKSMLRTAVRWTFEIAGGLHAAHEAGIIHRDIKPSNIYVRGNGHPVLLDFGIAASEQHATITRDGGALGTPAYMAPETLQEGHEPNRAVDVYGLCATLYHLVTARAPFRGTPSQVLTSLRKSEPVPAFRLRPGLPRDLQAILDKGMARSPKDRYQSAEELARDLRAFLNYEPVSARPLSTTTRLLRRARRSTAMRAGALVALLAGLAIAVPTLIEAWRSKRDFQWNEVWAQLPAGTTLVGQRNRQVHDPDELAYIHDVLDRSAALCLEPIPTLAVRAAFRMDQGDLAGSRLDMHAIHSSVGTELTAAVAKQFDLLDVGATASHLTLDALPAPATGQGAMLLAYLNLRVRNTQPAVEALQHPALANSPTAEEMRINVTLDYLVREKTTKAATAFAIRLHEQVIAHEQAINRMTAQTAHVGAYALYRQQRYEQCYERARRGLELAPYSYTMRINAGQSARRLGRTADALAMLAGATRLRPQYWKPYWIMFQACIDVLDLEQAAQLLAKADKLDDPAATGFVRTMHGVLASERALALIVDGDRAAARAAAKQSVEHFAAAAELRSVNATTHWAVSKALLAGDRKDIFRCLVLDLCERPLDWRHFEQVIHWMPDKPTPADVEAWRQLLRSISRKLRESGRD